MLKILIGINLISLAHQLPSNGKSDVKDGPEPSILGSVDKVLQSVNNFDQLQCIQKMICEYMGSTEDAVLSAVSNNFGPQVGQLAQNNLNQFANNPNQFLQTFPGNTNKQFNQQQQFQTPFNNQQNQFLQTIPLSQQQQLLQQQQIPLNQFSQQNQLFQQQQTPLNQLNYQQNQLLQQQQLLLNQLNYQQNQLLQQQQQQIPVNQLNYQQNQLLQQQQLPLNQLNYQQNQFVQPQRIPPNQYVNQQSFQNHIPLRRVQNNFQQNGAGYNRQNLASGRTIEKQSKELPSEELSEEPPSNKNRREKRQTSIHGHAIKMMQSFGLDKMAAYPYVRAAIIGHANKDRPLNCRQLFRQCPDSTDQLLEYLNNNNGGLFQNAIPSATSEVNSLFPGLSSLPQIAASTFGDLAETSSSSGEPGIVENLIDAIAGTIASATGKK